jgi:hypothetical protein
MQVKKTEVLKSDIAESREETKEELESRILAEMQKTDLLVSKHVDQKVTSTCYNNFNAHGYIHNDCYCGDFYTSSSCSTGIGCYGYNGHFYCNPSYWDEKCCY